MSTMESDPVIDAETRALIDRVIASFECFANEPPSTEWRPELGPSQIGVSYHDYEDPLTYEERYLLEHPDDIQNGWGLPDDEPEVAPQNWDVPWDEDAETSEDYKQEQIMAAQHRQVMEERVMNGLRMPSPSPRAQEGRIAAVAQSLRTASKAARSLLPPLMNVLSPFEARGRSRGCRCFMSDNTGQDYSRFGFSPHRYRFSTLPVNCDDPIHARRLGHSDGFRSSRRRRSCEDLQNNHQNSRADGAKSYTDLSEPINATCELVKRHLNDSSSQSRKTTQQLNTTRSITSDPTQRSLLRSEQSTTDPESRISDQTSHKVHFSGLLDAEDDDESNDSEISTPRPTKNKGKGKERASSPSPSPKAKRPSSTTPLSIFEADAVYDPEVGEYVVYIPWSYRDPVQDRINDSKVTEIRLGDEEGDECDIQIVSGIVGVGDFQKEERGSGSNGAGHIDCDGDRDGEEEWSLWDSNKALRKNERLILAGL